MSRKVVNILLYVCLLAAPTFGQLQEDVFGDDLGDALDEVVALNDARNYLEAYRQVLLAERKVDEALSEKHVNPSALNKWEFQSRYWPIKKSKAEIAYMLGIYSDMESVSEELHQVLKYKENTGIFDKATLDGLKADLFKIDGSRYYLTEKYDSAEVALRNALRVGSFHGNDLFVCKVHDDLAQLYYKQELYNKALAHLDSVLASKPYQSDSRNRETLQNIRLVESQRALCLARLGLFADALKEMEPVVLYFQKINDKRLFAESLRKKAKILMLQYDATGKYSPDAVKCYQRYLAISRDFIDKHFVRMSESEREQYWMAEQPFVTDCFRLEDKAPGLLYDVALYSKAILLQMGRDFKEGMTEAQRKEALASIRVTWQQVREKLPASGCAIEFSVFEKKGENHLGALVIDKKSANPKFMDIGRTEDILSYKVTQACSVRDILANTRNEGYINALYNDSTLWNLIWNEEIVSAIGNSRDIYFSPDGIFYQIGIEYMTPAPIASRNFYRLTTTRLITVGHHRVNTDDMLLCGDIDYNLATEDKDKGNDALAYSLYAQLGNRWDSLPGSRIEIDSVRYFRSRHHFDDVLCADSVTEKALTNLLQKHHIALISTHGHFTEASTMGNDIRPAATDTQLSQNCLILSGANKSLTDGSFDASQHDGILSAREISKLDLSSTDLVILSACMSGLGYITPDGVFGLQRGFKTAGVGAVICTLWIINDEASSHFVVQLNKKLEEGMSIHDAFCSARNHVRDMVVTQKYADFVRKKTFKSPYYTNAFILIDGLQ